jgi:outer membrane protein TolC
MMRATLLLLLLGLAAAPAAAQDTLHLSALQDAALAHDPRARQLALQEQASRLRLGNLAAAWLPSLAANGQATYQSEVASIPVRIPGAEIPEPPKDRYALTLDAEQLLYDSGALRGRRGVEAARLAAERAQLEAALFPLRAEVNAAFFQALLADARLAEAAVLIDDLEARLALVRAQAKNGAALPGDTAAVRAELLRALQSRDAAAAGRRAALAVLSELTGVPVADADALALPELGAAAARVRAEAGDRAPQLHPQYAVYAAQREQLARQSAALRARTGPRLSAFGQLGYGRPGLAQFTRDFHDYWMAGLRLHWQPWDWRTTARQREELDVQRQIVTTEAAALTARLERQVQDALATIDRLERALELDEQIVVLREQVERQARAQLAERVITPSAYIDVRTDLQNARLAWRQHRIELEQARAQYLTTLGVIP